MSRAASTSVVSVVVSITTPPYSASPGASSSVASLPASALTVSPGTVTVDPVGSSGESTNRRFALTVSTASPSVTSADSCVLFRIRNASSSSSSGLSMSTVANRPRVAVTLLLRPTPSVSKLNTPFRSAITSESTPDGTISSNEASSGAIARSKSRSVSVRVNAPDANTVVVAAAAADRLAISFLRPIFISVSSVTGRLFRAVPCRYRPVRAYDCGRSIVLPPESRFRNVVAHSLGAFGASVLRSALNRRSESR